MQSKPAGAKFNNFCLTNTSCDQVRDNRAIVLYGLSAGGMATYHIAALKACMADQTSAGKWVTMQFLATYMRYNPAIEPEDFDVCPILLTQPAMDRWTPLHLSALFLQRVARVPVTTIMLDNAGHYPLEQPGLDQMVEAIHNFCIDVTHKGKDQ